MKNMPDELKQLLMLALLKKLMGQSDGPEIEITKADSFEEFKAMFEGMPGKDQSEIKAKYEKAIDRDYTEKKIGDTVIVNNKHLVNYLIDVKTGKQVTRGQERPTVEQYEMITHKAIVVGVDDEFTFLCDHCDHPHTANLIIYYPHNKLKFRINHYDTHIVDAIEG